MRLRPLRLNSKRRRPTLANRLRRRRRVESAVERIARTTGRPDRNALPRPLRLARREPIGIRLLRPDYVRLQAAGSVAAALHRVAVERGPTCRAYPPVARRPGVL